MAEIVPLKLTPAAALKVIREMAEDSGRIVVIRHGKERQRQRKITRLQIERCVRLGTIIEGPFLNQHGNWQVTLQRHAAGDQIRCVVAIEWATRLLVITTF